MDTSLIAEMLGLRAPEKRWAECFGIRKQELGCEVRSKSRPGDSNRITCTRVMCAGIQ